MALALLVLEGIDSRRARLRIDTGTNRYYQLKVGRARTQRAGLDWLDDILWQSPLTQNPRGGGVLRTDTEAWVPLAPPGRAPGEPTYVQLFTSKTRDGR